MNIVFQISGGIGKCVAATAVCEAITKKYPKHQLIVVSAYPEVFINNPHISKTFNFNSINYFYQDFIEGKNAIVLAHDPYVDQRFVGHENHLIKIWCEMFNIPYNGEQPKIYLTEREKSFFSQKYGQVADKPILVMQTNGGAENQVLKYSWARDIPNDVVMAVIEEFKSEMNIVHIRREDQMAFPDTMAITDTFRGVACFLQLSKVRFFMDSFAQHTAAALGLPSTVCWIANSPKVFGYKTNHNICSNDFTAKPELRGSYLSKFNIAGEPLEFPYQSEADIFNVEAIIKSLRNQLGEQNGSERTTHKKPFKRQPTLVKRQPKSPLSKA